jgi:hypothetical protein
MASLAGPLGSFVLMLDHQLGRFGSLKGKDTG